MNKKPYTSPYLEQIRFDFDRIMYETVLDSRREDSGIYIDDGDTGDD